MVLQPMNLPEQRYVFADRLRIKCCPSILDRVMEAYVSDILQRTISEGIQVNGVMKDITFLESLENDG